MIFLSSTLSSPSCSLLALDISHQVPWLVHEIRELSPYFWAPKKRLEMMIYLTGLTGVETITLTFPCGKNPPNKWSLIYTLYISPNFCHIVCYSRIETPKNFGAFPNIKLSNPYSYPRKLECFLRALERKHQHWEEFYECFFFLPSGFLWSEK